MQAQMQAYFLNLDPQQRKQKIMSEMVKTHSDPNKIHPDKWSCVLCNQMFTRKQSAIDHFEGQHLQLLSYQCVYCSRLFHSVGQQRLHIHQYHREEHIISKLK